MRRTFIALITTIGVVGGLAVPAAGQDDNPLTINPDHGLPGDIVAAHVDPDVVADSCMTSIEEIQALFDSDDGEVTQAWLDRGDEVGLDDDPVTWFLFFALGPDPTVHDNETLAAALLSSAMVEGLAADDTVTAQLLAQLFVLTFVDIATQDQVGEPTSFDPTSGHGQIIVPDLEPGLWAIAATCVEPVVTDESFQAAVAAGAAWLDETYGPDVEDAYAAIRGENLAEGWAEAATGIAPVMLPELMQPQEGAGPWVQPFTIPRTPAEVDPAVEAFCAVLPEISPLGEEITAALQALPEDDGTLDDEEWAASEDWDAIGDELRALFATAEELLAVGDEARPDAVAPQWETVTAPLREARDALEAVDFDLSTPSGRQIAEQLREGASGDETDPASEAATEVLTEWFLANCVAEAPAPAPAEETPREAPVAVPVAAQPTFTG